MTPDSSVCRGGTTADRILVLVRNKTHGTAGNGGSVHFSPAGKQTEVPVVFAVTGGARVALFHTAASPRARRNQHGHTQNIKKRDETKEKSQKTRTKTKVCTETGGPAAGVT